MSDVSEPVEKKTRAPRKTGARKAVKNDRRSAMLLLAAVVLAAINLAVAGHIATVVRTVEAEMSWKK